jgi:serralysin
LSGDGKTFEVAVRKDTIGSPTAIDVLADVNNQVNKFTVSQNQFIPKTTYGNLILDGNLNDWTSNERLDFLPGTANPNYAVYGKFTQDAYLFAINSKDLVIGKDTTIWLNTDRNSKTGYQIFGSAGGAEYNINIASNGEAYLYRGGAGEKFVSKLDYKLSGDGKTFEVAVRKNMMGSPTAIDVLADVNNQVYLPGDYAVNKFTVSQNQFIPKTTYGSLTLDGNLNDWNKLDRLDFLPSTTNPNYAVYGRSTQDGYVFAINSKDLAIGKDTTIWLNTDRNSKTGYQIFGSTGGAEYNINIASNGEAYLYSGGAGENFVSKLDYKLSADGKTFEVAVRKDAIGNPTAIDVLADVNNQVYLPGDYSSSGFTVDSQTLPQPTDSNKKIGIIYSETSANNFFEKKSYSRLFMNVQQQAMQAGIPFDLLTEKDLTDMSKVAQYDTLVFPSFSYVNSSLVNTIEQNLTNAVYKYGTNLVAAGNFMTNDETGAFIGSNRMQNLLGVNSDYRNLQEIDGLAPTASADAVVKVKDINGGILQGYTANEQIYTYKQLAQYELPVFNSLNNSGTVLAEQTVNGKNYNAIITSKTGGNNVHFASEDILANSNVLWQALQSQTLGDGAKVGLSMTRDTSLLMTRNDVDLSKFQDFGPKVQNKLADILTEWKGRYGFVGSHYINIGVDGSTAEGQGIIAHYCPYCSPNPGEREGTNWEVMRPIYEKWVNLGNEIGTHSYTHPYFVGDLTPEQIKFEFEQSRQEISKELGIKVTGAATPGNPEDYGRSTIDAVMSLSIPNSFTSIERSKSILVRRKCKVI